MVQLGLLRSTLVYFSPLWSHSVHFGLLQSTVVPFSPIWSTGEIFFPQMLCLGRELTKTKHLGKKKFSQWISSLRVSRSTGEIFFCPHALFRPRAYKNRACGQKNISPMDLETLRLEIHWGNFFSPDALFL